MSCIQPLLDFHLPLEYSSVELFDESSFPSDFDAVFPIALVQVIK